MKTALKAVIVWGMMSFAGTLCWASDANSWINIEGNGNGFTAYCQHYWTDPLSDLSDYGFCTGFVQAVELTASNAGIVCLPAGITIGQGYDIASKYIFDNPARRTENTVVLVLESLQPFACKK